MVTFVGADSGGGNVANINTASPSPANPVVWPAVQAGDVAIVLWIMQNTVTPTIPAGWTVPSGGSLDGGGASRYRVMWRLCDGTESGNLSLTNSTATVNRQSAVLVVYRGLDATAPIDVVASRNETSAGTTHASPSVTTGVANAVIWAGVGERSTSGTNGWTAPSGYTERADSVTAATGSGGTIVAGADDGLATIRASGTVVTPPAWTSTNSFSTANVATWTVSLKPGTATVSGSAALPGAGTLTAVATVRVKASSADAASGSLAAGAIVRVRAAVAAGASGALTAAAKVRIRTAVAPTATSALSASAAVRVQAAESVSASGSFAASARVRTTAVVPLASSGALSVSSVVRRPGQAALSSLGNLTAGAQVRVLTAADLSAISDLTTASTIVRGSAVFAGAGVLAAAGHAQVFGAGGLAAAGVLAVQAFARVKAMAHLPALATLTVRGPSRGAMDGRDRPIPDVLAAARDGSRTAVLARVGAHSDAVDRHGPDLSEAERLGAHAMSRPRAGASMGG